MSRYVIQFYKKDALKYISHLDLLRLFKRTFKRTGLALVYSQGFNPHPKMSFAQPLSLGYEGEREYLDFETVSPHECEDIVAGLNGALPAGVAVTGCRALPHSRRTLAAVAEYARYTVLLPAAETDPTLIAGSIRQFLAQSEIIVEKKQKKTGKIVRSDIRPMILDLQYAGNMDNQCAGNMGEQCAGDIEKQYADNADNQCTVNIDNNSIMLTMTICAGSNRNLNPEILLKAFCEYSRMPFCPEETVIIRNELFFREGASEDLRSLFDFMPAVIQ